MATIWEWFLSTTIGRWIVGIGAVIMAALGLGAFAFMKGKEHQADADKAKDAQAETQAAKQAQAIQTDAQKAADAVPAPKAPDPIGRNDLDTTQ